MFKTKSKLNYSYFKSIPFTYKVFGIFCSMALTFFGVYLFVHAGNIDSPAVPATDTGRMYTLEQIYQKFYTGTTATKQSGGFAEPGLAPGSTMHTLDNIYGDFSTDATATNGTVATDVRSGKTFFATSGISRGTSWGPVAGIMANCSEGGNSCYANSGYWTATAGSNVSGSAGSLSFSIPTGYYSGNSCIASDASNLFAGNIKSGSTVFGVQGALNYRIPDTGQATCYNATVATACGDSSWPRQDADTVGNASACAHTNTQYTVGTYTAIDTCNGLEWQKYGDGASDGYSSPIGNGPPYTGSNCATSTGYTAGSPNACKYSWQDALKYCNGLNMIGADGQYHTDWRLPNINELLSIMIPEYNTIANVKNQAGAPYINNLSGFSNTISTYWSSTTYPSSTTTAFCVLFNTGNASGNNKTFANYVRCVRGQ